MLASTSARRNRTSGGTHGARVRPLFDFHGNSDEAIATALRSLEIDILIDLMGHTHMAPWRTGGPAIARFRSNYLGYPGTTGAPFVDFIIADPVLIEPDDRDYYDEEKIVTLPHAYQPNDDKRALPVVPWQSDGPRPAGRGLRLCCFNNSFKITPVEFDIWMRLLQQIEGSVLWLLQPTDVAERNLRREAAARGVDASRLASLHRGYRPCHALWASPPCRFVPRYLQLQRAYHRQRCAVVGPAGVDLSR